MIRSQLAIVSLFFFAAQTKAQDPHAAQPERPTVATHAGTVAPGWTELEAGAEFDHYADRSRGLVTPILLKTGLAPRVQLSIQALLVRAPGESATEIGDLFVGVKWRLAEDAPVVGRFAILPSIKLPTGSTRNGAGTGTTDVGLLLISSHTFGALSMDLNAGYIHRGGNGSTVPRNATLWTASFGGPAAGRVGWAGEIYGYPGTSGPAGQKPIVAFLGGPTFEMYKWLVLDAGVIVPIGGPQPHALYSGLTWNIGRLWRASRQ